MLESSLEVRLGGEDDERPVFLDVFLSTCGEREREREREIEREREREREGERERERGRVIAVTNAYTSYKVVTQPIMTEA